jgi:uncharacterized membrane protein (UPF0127 family)
MHRWYAAVPFLVLILLLLAASAAAEICGYAEKGTLEISRGTATVTTFKVGLAEDREAYRKGLMGCRRLPAGSGLLFIYPDAARRVFWMKNTPLELAIVFVSQQGVIQAIEKGIPNSQRRIRSPDSIQYVLEINHAEAEPLAIGDRLTLKLHSQ